MAEQISVDLRNPHWYPVSLEAGTIVLLYIRVKHRLSITLRYISADDKADALHDAFLQLTTKCKRAQFNNPNTYDRRTPEIVKTVFDAIIYNSARGHPNIYDLTKLMETAVVNILRNRWKRGQILQFEELTEDRETEGHYGCDDTIEMEDRRRDIDRALGKFDEITRNCWLLQMENFRCHDIAEILGISTAAAKKTIQRCKPRLRRELAAYEFSR